MIDKYFKRPVIWDCILASIPTILFFALYQRKLLDIPSEDHLFSFISDLTTISLTMTGFVLTLLTVLISAKSTAKPIYDKLDDSESVFDAFFSSGFYFQTVKILKNAIIELSIVAVVGYAIKLLLSNAIVYFSYNLFGIVLVFFSVWRCVLILTRIVKLQQAN